MALNSLPHEGFTRPSLPQLHDQVHLSKLALGGLPKTLCILLVTLYPLSKH